MPVERRGWLLEIDRSGRAELVWGGGRSKVNKLAHFLLPLRDAGWNHVSLPPAQRPVVEQELQAIEGIEATFVESSLRRWTIPTDPDV